MKLRLVGLVCIAILMLLTQVQAAMPADYITVSEPPKSVTVGEDGYATINVTVKVTHIKNEYLPIYIYFLNDTYKQIQRYTVDPEIDWVNEGYKDYSASIGFRTNQTGSLHFFINAVSGNNNIFTYGYDIQINAKPMDGDDPVKNTIVNASLISIVVIMAVIGTIISYMTYKTRRQYLTSRQSTGAEIISGDTELNMHT